ncbi:MAG: LysR family transcriptional regulator [Proteobacteria bacterium]|nr:LysR family transcriptional regulator [Pseudomonadota bacterium]
MNNQDLRLLRSFIVLMTERSVTRAADQLGIGQPALSQTLGKLRALFKDPLLVRTRAGMVPTDRARELEQSARLVLAEYERMVAPTERFDPTTSRRRFVISVPEYAEHVLMPPLLYRLRCESPSVRVEARSPQPKQAVEYLESGRWDLRIAWLLTPTQSLRSMPLFQDQIVCLASQTHPEVKGRLTLDEFLKWPHVRPVGTGRPTTAVVLDDAVARVGCSFERPFLVQNFLTIPSIVSRTDMLATMPRTLAAVFAAHHSLQLLDIPLRLPRIRYAAYWHERSHMDLGHRWLRSKLMEVAHELTIGKRLGNTG